MSDSAIDTVEKSPVVTASESSWRCVQAGDKDGWLALMTDDIVIEDPIGPSVTNPDGNGVRGKAAVDIDRPSDIGPIRGFAGAAEDVDKAYRGRDPVAHAPRPAEAVASRPLS